MSDTPKSALEIVMERLKKRDTDAGVTEKPLTDEQRAQIAEARNVYESRVAQRRIMHQSETSSVFDPAALDIAHEELRRDLAQFESEQDAKVRAIRGE
ncbi:MAG TPA: hypothetical protein VNJ03_16015 [Vicinamibacterales bacterium]|nr:hypothetical protein [Vicinamibacterales bacterium]